MNECHDDLAHLLPLLEEIKQAQLSLEQTVNQYRQAQDNLRVIDGQLDQARDQVKYLHSVLNRCLLHNMEPVQAKLEITDIDVRQDRISVIDRYSIAL